MRKHRAMRHGTVPVSTPQPEAVIPPRLWPSLPESDRRRLARAFAVLLERMLPLGDGIKANRHVEPNR